MSNTDYSVALPVFEGPLDLLLHLVKKHELDIMDIPVSFVTEKYLEYLQVYQEQMRALNLEVAGEYLLMAATLAHLKSRELVPSPDPIEADEDEEDGADPRQELIARLLTYQKYKEAARGLGGRPVEGRNVWPRGASTYSVLPDEVDPRADAPLREVPLIKLIEALSAVLDKAKVVFSHEVAIERLSIGDRIHEIVDLLEVRGSFSFRECFALDEDMTPAQRKHHVVVTFLAVLEMAKLTLIKILQLGENGDIQISRTSDDIRGRAAGATSSFDEVGGVPGVH